MHPDFVTPREDSTRGLQEYANVIHQMYVKESWWTRCSLPFLYLACACIALSLILIWFSLPNREPTTGMYALLSLCFVLIIAHIKSQNRIHARFMAGHPEEYTIWQQSRKK